MADQMKVTVEDVRRVAELANLELTPGEQTAMLRDLNAILDHVAQLNELDTTNVMPMAQVSEVLSVRAEAFTKTTVHGADLREDRVVPSLNRAAVLDCAPESDGIFFKVPKVIER